MQRRDAPADVEARASTGRGKHVTAVMQGLIVGLIVFCVLHAVVPTAMIMSLIGAGIPALLAGLPPDDAWLNYVAVVGGTVSALIVAFSFVVQLKWAPAYFVSIIGRVAPVGAGIGLLRLALRGEHLPSSMLFLALGLTLLGVGGLAVSAVVADTERAPHFLRRLRERMPSPRRLNWLVYTSCAASLVLVSAYTSGRRTLTCVRRGETRTVDCTLDTYRWLGGLHLRRRLERVHTGRDELFFGGSGGVVLISDGGEMTVADVKSDGASIRYGLFSDFNSFLESSARTRRYEETTFFNLPVFGVIAVIYAAMGGAADPLRKESRNAKTEQSRKKHADA